MVTARHLEVTDAYLHDLREAVATVKADPSLAGKGRAATYGMLAHLPLRGLVKSRVLDMFAASYGAGAEPIDLEHAADQPKPWLERVAAWVVARRQRG